MYDIYRMLSERAIELIKGKGCSMNIEDGILREIKYKYKTVKGFSNVIDLPYTTVDSILKRGILNSSVSNVVKIFVELDLDLEKTVLRNSLTSKLKLLKIPYYDYPASAGTGIPLEADDHSLIEIPEGMDVSCAVRVSGDSMEPRFFDGDIVLVREQQNLDFGDIGVFILNGEGYIKRYSKNGLESLNKKYSVIRISEDDDCKLFGRVIKTLD